jgi:hypothetical protein
MHSVKQKAHSNLGENAISWSKAQIHDAKLGKKDGHRAQISSVGGKLLYEIHTWSRVYRKPTCM